MNRKLYLAFAAAVFVLLGLGATSYRGIVEFSESNRWVRHTGEVLKNLQDLSSAMSRIESSYRGYVLTGQESYVEACHADMLVAKQREAAVRTLTEDNTLQRSRIADIQRLTLAKLQFGEMVIDLRRTQGFDAAADKIRAGAGQRIMDEFQALVGNMENEERRLLVQRTGDAKRRVRQTEVVLSLGTLLGVLIAAGAGWAVRRDSAARDFAEEALREGQERFRTMANNISQLAWMADENGSIFWYNQRWFNYCGTTLEEMSGSGWEKVHHPDHVQRVVDKTDQGFRSGEGWEDRFPLRSKDGTYRWFLSRTASIRDSEGKVLRWFSTSTDITQLRDAEEHLAQMEGRYRGLLEAAPDAMVVVNQSGEIVLLNLQAEKQFGYRRDELVGQKVKNIVPEGFAERLIADGTRSASEALAQRIGTGIELLGRRKDGSQFPIEIMLSPLEGAEGILVTAAIRNISARKAAEEHLAQMDRQRKHTENALRESEERYRMLLDGIPDYAIFMMDAQGRVLSWNAGAERLKGYKPDEIIGENFSCFFLPEDIKRGRPEEILRNTAAAGRHEEQAMRMRKDGSRFLASLSFTALRDAQGILRGFAEFGHDLTESTESGAKYRGLLEAAPDAMVVVNQGGEIVLLNVQAEKQFGYRRDELVGQKVKSIIPEGFAERLISDATRSAADALAQQIGTGIELLGRRKDGSQFPIEIMLSPLESTEGVLVTAAIRDITVRKAAEEHLAQMEGRYRGLLEAAPDAMVVVNQGGDIVLLNVQAEKQFGYRRDELLGQRVKNIIPEGFAERLIADGTRSAADALAQQIGTGIELLGRRKDGSRFPIEIMLSPLESTEGILVTAAIRNISARKESEEHSAKLEDQAVSLQRTRDELELRVSERTKELAVAVQVLEQSNLELKQFAYVASHDLQSPLRSISGFVQLLKIEYEGKLDEQAQDWIRRTVQSIAKMQTLIRDLLSYSRVDARSRPFAQTSFLDIVNDAMALLDSSIHDSGAQITTGELPAIACDRSQMVQLIQNLVGNALTYHSDKAPHIHISSEHSGKEWTFSVRDNGIGIDPNYYEQIFEIFKRLHGQKEYPGTGIGLAVCRRVVERHGGKIWVKSDPGQGSTFYFTIPERTEQKNAP